MNPLREVWEFPAHYVVLAWWITALLTIWNVGPTIRSLAGRVALLGRRFQKDQLAKRLRNLEYLHENTNGLIRYIAEDAVDVAVETSYLIVVLSIISVYASYSSPASPFRSCIMLAMVGINVSTSVVGRAWRIRAMLRDLKNYHASVEAMKVKLDKL
jgi:hypothetical protein